MASATSIATGSLSFSTATPVPEVTNLLTTTPGPSISDDVSFLPNPFATGASFGEPALGEEESGNRPLRTAQITVDPTKPLTLEDIMAQLRAYGIEVDGKSQVIVAGPEATEGGTGAKLIDSDIAPANSSSFLPEIMTLKDLPIFIRNIVAWENIKGLAIKVGQRLKPVIIRWVARRRMRRFLYGENRNPI